MKITSFLACAVMGLTGLGAATAHADPVEIKIATLAPRGSSWAKMLEQWGADVATATNNRVTVRMYENGEQGDERDVVRKMKLGQVNGSAITAVGLGLIKPDVRILELPFLFRSDDELDYVRNKMSDAFTKQFDDAGYALLAWGDVGWVHLFSNIPITSVKDLGATKMWAWTDDPIVRSYFKKLGVNGVPLGVPDVLPALQTGAIDACYGSPLAVVALKWYTKVKYFTDLPISYSIGAVVIRKEVMNKLSAADQAVLHTTAQDLGAKLKVAVRKDNEHAKASMIKVGLQVSKTPQETIDDFEHKAQEVWIDLTGDMFGKDLFAMVKKYRDEARAAHK